MSQLTEKNILVVPDIPVIMNLSPFKTRFELLFEKAGLTISEFKGNKYTEYGEKMEQKIIDYLNDTEMYEDAFQENQVINGNRRYNADGVNSVRVLEVKTTSQVKETIDEYKMYLSQLLEGMEQFEKDLGTLAVYERPEDFEEQLAKNELKFENERLQLFDIEFKDYELFVTRKNNAVELFEADVEKVKENPLITEEELQPQEIQDLAKIIVEDEKVFKELETKHTENKAKLKKLLETYGNKGFETDAGVKVTLVEDGDNKIVEVKKYQDELFEKENPEIVSMYKNACETYEDVRENYTYTEKTVSKGKAGHIRITMPKGKDK